MVTNLLGEEVVLFAALDGINESSRGEIVKVNKDGSIVIALSKEYTTTNGREEGVQTYQPGTLLYFDSFQALRLAKYYDAEVKRKMEEELDELEDNK